MAGNTVVVNIVGNVRGLQKSLAQANQSLGGLQRISQSLGGAFKGAAIGAAVFGAAAIGAGAAGAAALVGLGAGVVGLGIAFAAMDDRVSGAFGSLKTNVSTAMQELSKPFIEPLIRSAAALQTAFDSLKPAIGQVFTQAAPLIDRFNAALTTLAPAIGGILTNGFAAALPVMNAFIDGLTPLLDGVNKFFVELGSGSGQFATFTTALMGGIGQLLPAFGRLLVALAPIGTTLLNLLVPALISVADFISRNVGPAFETLSGIISRNEGLFKGIGIAIVSLLVGVKVLSVGLAAFSAVTGAVGVVVTVFSKVFGLLKGVFTVVTTAWRILSLAFAISPFGVIIIGIGLLIAALVLAYQKSETFRNIVNGAFNAVKSVATSVFNAVKGAISSVVSAVGSAAGGIGSAMSSAGAAFGRFASAVSSGIASAIGFVRSIPGRITGALGNLGGLLVNAGRQVIQGLINGVSGMVGALRAKFTSITNLIPDWKGPYNKDKKLLTPAGIAIMNGLIKGIDKQKSALRSTLGDVTNLIEGGITPRSGSMELAFGGSGGSGAGGMYFAPGSIQVVAPVGSSSEEIGRTLTKHLDNYRRVNGR